MSWWGTAWRWGGNPGKAHARKAGPSPIQSPNQTGQGRAGSMLFILDSTSDHYFIHCSSSLHSVLFRFRFRFLLLQIITATPSGPISLSDVVAASLHRSREAHLTTTIDKYHAQPNPTSSGGAVRVDENTRKSQDCLVPTLTTLLPRNCWPTTDVYISVLSSEKKPLVVRISTSDGRYLVGTCLSMSLTSLACIRHHV